MMAQTVVNIHPVERSRVAVLKQVKNDLKNIRGFTRNTLIDGILHF